ncbi:hypothetical protein MHYP_G00295860 [Metynnis hypsauchen]
MPNCLIVSHLQYAKPAAADPIKQAANASHPVTQHPPCFGAKYLTRLLASDLQLLRVRLTCGRNQARHTRTHAKTDPERCPLVEGLRPVDIMTLTQG